MQVVKLDQRFRQCKNHGHTVAIKFAGYGHLPKIYEDTCRLRFGGDGYNRDHVWFGYFGKRNGSHFVGSLQYWISFRNETDLTMVLLSAKR